MIQKITKLYELLIRSANSLQSPFLLFVRVYWGWQFAETGWGKLGNINKVINFFTSLGIPAPALNAWFVSGLELVGGIILLLGLGSRLIALPLVIDMIVAYITADREALGQHFLRSRQVLRRGALYVPLGVVDCSYLRSGKVLPGRAVDWKVPRRGHGKRFSYNVE